MTEKFEIKLLPDPYYKKYAGEGKRLQELVNIQFDIVKDGVPFDNGYNRMEQCTHLGLIMLAMDAMEFLDGEIQDDVRLWTKIPHFMGKDLVYRYFFDVHVTDSKKYWVFHYSNDPNHTIEFDDDMDERDDNFKEIDPGQADSRDESGLSENAASEKIDYDEWEDLDWDMDDNAESPEQEAESQEESDNGINPEDIIPRIPLCSMEGVDRNLYGERISIDYSCELTEDQVRSLLESLSEQVRSFDWETYGTTEQYAFDLPEKDYVEYRRAQELQDALSCCLQGARFQKVFVSAVDYADEFRRYYEDLGFDFTLGYRIILLFDRILADMLIDGHGYVKARFFNTDEFSVRSFNSAVEFRKPYMCEINADLPVNCEGETVEHIIIREHETEWIFPEKDIDDIDLRLSNNKEITIIGDASAEGFFINTKILNS